eukprot:m.237586 g.237586  ORF g.237586 m.237586 type:complete len:425 (-) comp33710_c2_seq2:1338-2612(-)
MDDFDDDFFGENVDPLALLNMMAPSPAKLVTKSRYEEKKVPLAKQIIINARKKETERQAALRKAVLASSSESLESTTATERNRTPLVDLTPDDPNKPNDVDDEDDDEVYFGIVSTQEFSKRHNIIKAQVTSVVAPKPSLEDDEDAEVYFGAVSSQEFKKRVDIIKASATATLSAVTTSIVPPVIKANNTTCNDTHIKNKLIVTGSNNDLMNHTTITQNHVIDIDAIKTTHSNLVDLIDINTTHNNLVDIVNTEATHNNLINLDEGQPTLAPKDSNAEELDDDNVYFGAVSSQEFKKRVDIIKAQVHSVAPYAVSASTLTPVEVEVANPTNNLIDIDELIGITNVTTTTSDHVGAVSTNNDLIDFDPCCNTVAQASQQHNEPTQKQNLGVSEVAKKVPRMSALPKKVQRVELPTKIPVRLSKPNK